jgi:hypothetical protein
VHQIVSHNVRPRPDTQKGASTTSSSESRRCSCFCPTTSIRLSAHPLDFEHIFEGFFSFSGGGGKKYASSFTANYLGISPISFASLDFK